MVSERAVRISHTIIFILTLLAAIVVVAISGSLVGRYNNDGYPRFHTGAYEARIRIILVAGVWTTAFALILLIGFQMLGNHRAFGILAHLIPMVIGFILFIIGSSSLTALTRFITCGEGEGKFDHCNIVKGLVIISWIDTIFVFISIIFVLVMGLIAHRGYGMHKATLYAE
ncbi:hypothetical protein BD324DRAFT_618460 [Kockovaella imperatae]|uniref:MARVEL domain-containing protein n=1 Tax=Kockovaella imperatae TaxID=4999 RepID=A0A1Y1UM01_9TREE|nr:hypothetical protein BD324DRAFT_618460 [Kockovaella imperatae]ORX39081.1 hypothetical protein BD324DRAFT_618460 [Kockovaella imperatae]